MFGSTGEAMVPPGRYLNGICAFVFATLVLHFPVLAKEYHWEKYSAPLTEKIRVASAVDVMVDLPELLLAATEDLRLVIEHLGIGNDGSGELRGILTVNNQSFWKSYTFGNSKFTEDPITIAIKTKDLKSGVNKLRFSSQRSGSTVQGWYTITRLRFNLPKLANINVQPVEASQTAHASNSKIADASSKRGPSIAKSSLANSEKYPVGSGSGPRLKPLAFGNYHALVIGNNDYQNISRLKTAVTDAKAVAALLQQKYKFNVSLLLNATRSEIFLAVSKMRGMLNRTDNLLVYYAGHGNIDPETQRGYWLPVDAERSNKANWIANEDITSELKAIKAKHVLIIADSCYSGTLTRGPDVATMRSGSAEEWVLRMAARRSRTVLTSGGLEPVLDAGGGRHSVFAQAFLRTLKDNEQIIDMDSLYETIRRRVVLNARQTPLYSDIRFAGHDDGDFVFVPR